MEAIREIKAPTLLIIGDSDVVRPEHTVELFRPARRWGGGRSRRPATFSARGASRQTHVTLADRPEWLVSMITQFLDVKDAWASENDE